MMNVREKKKKMILDIMDGNVSIILPLAIQHGYKILKSHRYHAYQKEEIKTNVLMLMILLLFNEKKKKKRLNQIKKYEIKWELTGCIQVRERFFYIYIQNVCRDGTKRIMYKDVKRNGSEISDRVYTIPRMNGGGEVGGKEKEVSGVAKDTEEEEDEEKDNKRKRKEKKKFF